MKFSSDPRSDQQMEVVIGNLLRAGITIASLTVLAGGLVYLVRHGLEHPHYTQFHGVPSELTSIRRTIAFAASGHGRGLIQVGLLLLIATPVARVAFSIFGFAKEKDWLYVSFTVVVLTVLLYTLSGI